MPKSKRRADRGRSQIPHRSSRRRGRLPVTILMIIAGFAVIALLFAGFSGFGAQTTPIVTPAGLVDSAALYLGWLASGSS